MRFLSALLALAGSFAAGDAANVDVTATASAGWTKVSGKVVGVASAAYDRTYAVDGKGALLQYSLDAEQWQPSKMNAPELASLAVDCSGTLWATRKADGCVLKAGDDPKAPGKQALLPVQEKACLGVDSFDVGSRGNVWAVARANNSVLHFNAATSSWSDSGAVANDVAVSCKDDVFAVTKADHLWEFISTNDWKELAVGVGSVAAGHAMFVNDLKGELYRYDSGDWFKMNATVTGVSAGPDGSLWGVDAPSKTAFHFTDSFPEAPLAAGKKVSLAARQQGSWEKIAPAKKWKVAGIADTRVKARALNIIATTGELLRYNTRATSWRAINATALPPAPERIETVTNVTVPANSTEDAGVDAVETVTKTVVTFKQAPGVTLKFRAVAETCSGGARFGISADDSFAGYWFNTTDSYWYPLGVKNGTATPLVDIAAGKNRDQVYAIERGTNQLLVLNAKTLQWVRQGSEPLAQLSVRCSGSIWAVTAAGQLLRRSRSRRTWRVMGKDVKAVSAGRSVMVLDDNNRLYQYRAPRELGAPEGKEQWRDMNQELVQVVASRRRWWGIVGIDLSGNLVEYHRSMADPVNRRWTALEGVGTVNSVCVSNRDEIWALDRGLVYTLSGFQSLNVFDGIDGASQMSCGCDGSLWVIKDGQVHREENGLFLPIGDVDAVAQLTGPGVGVDANEKAVEWNGADWVAIGDGKASVQSVDRCGDNVAAVSTAGVVMTLNTTTNVWTNVGRGAATVSVGKDVMFVTGANRGVFRRNMQGKDTRWRRQGFLANVSVGYDGAAMGVNKDGELYVVSRGDRSIKDEPFRLYHDVDGQAPSTARPGSEPELKKLDEVAPLMHHQGIPIYAPTPANPEPYNPFGEGADDAKPIGGLLDDSLPTAVPPSDK